MTGLTEKDLMDAGCGKHIANRTPGYDKKKAIYTAEKLWGEYCRVRGNYRHQMTHPMTGYVDNNGAEKMAQVEIDSILYRRVRGTEAAPAAVVEDTSDETLKPAAAFKQNLDPLDNNAIIEWVFNNIGRKDVKPDEAPWPGAYTYLLRIQSDADSMTDFYKTIWPKTFTKDQNKDTKYNDDGRPVAELIKRLQTEVSGNPAIEPIPVL
jgi:hypothetical protein